MVSESNTMRVIKGDFWSYIIFVELLSTVGHDEVDSIIGTVNKNIDPSLFFIDLFKQLTDGFWIAVITVNDDGLAWTGIVYLKS